MPSLIGHHLRVLSGGSVSNGPCDRELTTKAKPLICDDSVSNDPCDRDYAITVRPLCPLPLRLLIRLGILREDGRGRIRPDNSLTSLALCPGPLQLVQGLAR